MRGYDERLRAASPPWSSDEEMATRQEGTAIDLVRVPL